MGGQSGSWTPTKRRGPIAAEFRGPGPASLVLPALFGSENNILMWNHGWVAMTRAKLSHELTSVVLPWHPLAYLNCKSANPPTHMARNLRLPDETRA